MKLQLCVACGSKDDLQHHHLVTRAEGGSNAETNLITLCTPCHHKLHKRQMNGVYDRNKRLQEGKQRAQARGVKLGRRPKLTPLQRQEAIARCEAGETLTDVSRDYGVHHSTICRLWGKQTGQN